MTTQERIDELKQCAVWETHVSSLEALALKMDSELTEKTNEVARLREQKQEELDGISNNHVIRALRLFGCEKISKDGSLESWINLGAYRLEKVEKEVARLNEERDNLQKNLNALAGYFYRAMQIVEGFKVTLETVTEGEVECKQLKELREDMEAYSKANKSK
jgi:hypothetical protein